MLKSSPGSLIRDHSWQGPGCHKGVPGIKPWLVTCYTVLYLLFCLCSPLEFPSSPITLPRLRNPPHQQPVYGFLRVESLSADRHESFLLPLTSLTWLYIPSHLLSAQPLQCVFRNLQGNLYSKQNRQPRPTTTQSLC